MIFNRQFCMPSKDTFSMRPVRELVERYMGDGTDWIDPYCGFLSWAQYRNDINPTCDNAKNHMDALGYVSMVSVILKMGGKHGVAGAIFDPPYSYRQVSEHYKQAGIKPTRLDTSANFYARVLDPLGHLIKEGGHAISFGWNSSGFGKKRGFEIVEILLLNHGGRHNDTIVTVEAKKNDRDNQSSLLHRMSFGLNCYSDRRVLFGKEEMGPRVRIRHDSRAVPALCLGGRRSEMEVE